MLLQLQLQVLQPHIDITLIRLPEVLCAFTDLVPFLLSHAQLLFAFVRIRVPSSETSALGTLKLQSYALHTLAARVAFGKIVRNEHDARRAGVHERVRYVAPMRY